MHGRGSRYRDVGETTRVDVAGRRTPATELRPPAPVEGVVDHVVTADDRLDRLADRYYGKPRRWWRIVDADPGVLSPLALLGQETVRTVRSRLAPHADAVAWYELLDAVRALVGVEDVTIALPPDVEHPELTVRLNTASLDPADVLGVVRDHRVDPGPLVPDQRLGAVVAIPTEGRS